MGTPRKTYLHARRHRKENLGKLRQKYQKARNQMEKDKILEKVRKISPFSLTKDFTL